MRTARERIVQPALALVDGADGRRLADEKRHIVALVIEPPEPGQEVARGVRLPDPEPAVQLPLQALLREHRIEIQADQWEIDGIILKPRKIALASPRIAAARTRGCGSGPHAR